MPRLVARRNMILHDVNVSLPSSHKYGFRGDEKNLEKIAKKYRCIIAGGGITMGSSHYDHSVAVPETKVTDFIREVRLTLKRSRVKDYGRLKWD